MNKTLEQFKIVRKNALANPALYDFRYTQKNRSAALKEYIKDALNK